jgi:Kdo2-lipid IVA 3' secondary acyltransferase
MITGWLLAQRFFPGREISAVVSLSGDGQILSDALDRLGFRLIRGSSSRGKEVVRRNIGVALVNRGVVAVTPDGPRGPQHRFKYGTLRLAAQHHAPVVFPEIRYSNARSLKSWDRFEIPMPFSRVKVTLHLVTVPDFATEEAFRAWADELSTTFADDAR